MGLKIYPLVANGGMPGSEVSESWRFSKTEIDQWSEVSAVGLGEQMKCVESR